MMTYQQTVRSNGPSPWGDVQDITVRAPGITAVSTASHGGIWLDQAHAAALLAALPGFRPWTGSAQWLEEDEEAALAVVLWPEAFPGAEDHDALVLAAHKTMTRRGITVPEEFRARHERVYAVRRDQFMPSGMSSVCPAPGWRCIFRRLGDGAMWRGDGAYPSSTFFTLDQLNTQYPGGILAAR